MSFKFLAIESTLGGVFRRTINATYNPALIAGIDPRFLSQAYLVSIWHSTFQVSSYIVYPQRLLSQAYLVSYFHLSFQNQEGGILFFIGGEGVSLLTYYFLFHTLPFNIRTYPSYILLFRLRLIPVTTLYPHTTVLFIEKWKPALAVGASGETLIKRCTQQVNK